MVILWSILGMTAFLLAGDCIFRRIVTPKICDIFENVPPFNVATDAEQQDAQPVGFRTVDGVQLAGSLLNADRPHPPGLVLFLPELRGNHWMARRYCQALLDRGFVVLSFDFRNQGGSEAMPGYTPIHWMTEFEMSDVAAAMEFIGSDSRLNKLPMIAFGISRGGVAALLAGCRYPRIRAVISDSAFGTMSMIRFFVDRFVWHVIPEWLYRLLPEWHVDMTLKQAVRLSESRRKCAYIHLEQEISGLDASSVLLISGSRDSYVTPEIAARLHAVVGHSAALWIAEGAKHNMSRSTQPVEYDRRVLAHATMCLGADLTQGLTVPAHRIADSPSSLLVPQSQSQF